MMPRKKLLTLESMNQWVRAANVPILGPLTTRAAEIQKEIQEGIHKPFTKITPCFYGDLQAMGHKPKTFLRQVAALCTYPELLESDRFPEDAKTRARGILQNLDNGSVGSYNESYITQTLPQKISSFLQRRDHGVPSNPRNIIVCSGTSQAIVSVLSLVVNDEEELNTGILLSVPYYPLYMDTIALSGAVKIPYYLDEEHGWAINVSQIREGLPAARKYCNPKVLCVINPGNPTGHVLTRENISELIHLAAEEDLLIIADEVYQENVFAPGAVFHSFKKVLYEMGPKYRERVQIISVNSISKGISGECGVRAGYIEFVNIDPAVFEVLYILKSFHIPSAIGTLMLEVVLDPPQPGDPSYDTFMMENQTLLNNLAQKAQITEKILNQSPGIHCYPIQGALYAFPRIQIPDRAIRLAQEQGQEPDEFFCHLLLEDTGIVLCTGSSFGQAAGTYHVRITLLHPIDELKSILQRIAQFHERFMSEYS
ncbi:alanine aminotransferase 2-like [Hyla sarda]|uniref:alanine aminotransferase 2-like n=1 Tax=Hyla sarda TaxID=327740 RepID=UPI0024C31660|nr:alanine aminotransferase 2-like [Hyla sarda]XP_056410881.1 alanine aminotransferase 2-like [Hyla sarda]XP_056410882.1 alanine aminotransferase 2-like [Hyla sarda]XP_056410883.1 alanine aminotransferase 2-like [Hyla sarda]XP_056410884.1 alanine aminotransferase 2-like [Hyla sarda]